MIRYNINNDTTIPSIYNEILYDEIKEEGWRYWVQGSAGEYFANDKTKLVEPWYDEEIFALEIGKKYYALLENECVAFKVVSFVFAQRVRCHALGYYGIIFANKPNVIEYIQIHSSIMHGTKGQNMFDYREHRLDKVFASKEDYVAYMQKESKCYLYTETKSIRDLFLSKYLDDGSLRISNVHHDYIHGVGNVDCVSLEVLCYELNQYKKPLRTYWGYFRYLWIDQNGLHYECPNYRQHELYTNKEEALLSYKGVCDFDENKDEEVVVVQDVKNFMFLPKIGDNDVLVLVNATYNNAILIKDIASKPEGIRREKVELLLSQLSVGCNYHYKIKQVVDRIYFCN